MKRFLLLFSLILITATQVFAAAEGSFQRTLQVNGPVDLEVNTRSGNITVRSGSSSAVIINARIKAGNSWFGADETSIRDIEQHPPISQ